MQNNKELQLIEEMAKEAIAAIQGQNWTDTPLTPEERLLIIMAVSWTYHHMKGLKRE